MSGEGRSHKQSLLLKKVSGSSHKEYRGEFLSEMSGYIYKLHFFFGPLAGKVICHKCQGLIIWGGLCYLYHIIFKVECHSLRHKAVRNLERIMTGICWIGADSTVKSKDISVGGIAHSENVVVSRSYFASYSSPQENTRLVSSKEAGYLNSGSRR